MRVKEGAECRNLVVLCQRASPGVMMTMIYDDVIIIIIIIIFIAWNNKREANNGIGALTIKADQTRGRTLR